MPHNLIATALLKIDQKASNKWPGLHPRCVDERFGFGKPFARALLQQKRGRTHLCEQFRRAGFVGIAHVAWNDIGAQRVAASEVLPGPLVQIERIADATLWGEWIQQKLGQRVRIEVNKFGQHVATRHRRCVSLQ